MPTYEITGPDGKTYEIDGPPGATREQVIAKVKEKIAAPQNRAMTDARKRSANTPGALRSFNQTAGVNLSDEIDATGAAIETGLNNFGAKLGLTKGAGYSARDAYDAVRRSETEAQNQFAKDHPGQNIAASLAGAVASPLNKIGAGWVGKGTNLVSKAARAAAVGGATSAAYGAGEGDSLKERTQNALTYGGTGALVGGALPIAGAVAKSAGRVMKAKAAPRARDVRLLQREGVNLTYGEMAGGLVKKTEDALSTLSGGISNAQRRAQEDLQRASINRALKPIGEKLSKGKAGREAVQELVAKRGAAYDKAFDGISFAPDAQTTSELQNAVSNNLFGADSATIRAAKTFVGDFLAGPTNRTGGLAGKDLTSVMSAISSKKAQAFKNNNRALGEFLVDLEGTIINTVERANPGKAAQIKAAKKAYMLSIRPEKAAGFLGAEGGVPTASQFQSAVKSSTGGPRKVQFSAGQAQMQDLGDAAVNIMTPSIRSSGTAERQAVLGALGASAVGGFFNPVLWAPVAADLVLRAAYSRPVLAAVNGIAKAKSPKAARAAIVQLKRLAKNNKEATAALQQMTARLAAMEAGRNAQANRKSDAPNMQPAQ